MMRYPHFVATDWAEEKAREWLLGMDEDDFTVGNVAALLREVAALHRFMQIDEDIPKGIRLAEEAKAGVLAEVRRVVEEAVIDVQKSIWGNPIGEGSAVTLCCDEILERLHSL